MNNTDVIEMAGLLAEKLKETEAHTNYERSKNKIHMDEDLTLKIYRYKKMNFDYQHKLMNNIEPSFDEEKKISGLYSELLLNDDARLFLESEKKLIDLVSDIYNIIGEACGLEIIM